MKILHDISISVDSGTRMRIQGQGPYTATERTLTVNLNDTDATLNVPLTSGNIGSGQVGVYHLQSGLATSGLYLSGSIGSGQIGRNHIAPGAIRSGHLMIGTVIGVLGGLPLTTSHIASGSIGTFDLGANALGSGNIGSGQVGVYHLQSGLATSGLYLSGSIGSGQIGRNHLSSGAGVTADFSGNVPSDFVYLVLSGAADNTFASTDGTYTLPSVTLPGAGAYLITATSRAIIAVGSPALPASITLRLLNSTTNVLVSGTETMGILFQASGRGDVTALVQGTIDVTSGHTIQLQAKHNFASGRTPQLASDANGRTVLRYLRLR